MKIVNENVCSFLASKTMENSMVRRVFAVTVVCVALLLSASQLGASEQRVINVSTVAQLYSAVNNDANVGVTIKLAPGTYVLSAKTAQGARRPHHGFLHLLPGMSLVGSEERVDSNFDGVPDPVSPTTPDDFAVPGTETNIDGSALIATPKQRKDCDGEGYPFGQAMIVISRNNTISSLHLFGADSAIGPNVGSVRNFSARVENTVLEGFTFGMLFANSECNARHARSVLTFSNNVVRNVLTFGLAIVNLLTGSKANEPTNGPEIKATVSYNLFYNNGTALTPRGGAYGTDGGLVTLEMTHNVFRNNGTNIFGIGCGGGRPVSHSAVGNRLHVTSRFDTFGEPPSGASVFLVAIRNVEPAEPQHCRLDAEFLHSNFVRDAPASGETPEILIIGGENGGSGNHAQVLIRNATVKTAAGAPTFGKLLIWDETGSGSEPNTARLRGSLEAFLQLNQGFHAPAAKFFLRK